MNRLLILSSVTGFACMAACSSSDAPTAQPQADETSLATSSVLDLDDIVTNPSDYEFMDFKPNVQKFILAGSADAEHVAVLWYTVTDGGVALHYHAKTESVYVIDGTQTDAKGVYPTGTVYFNPPGSGHEIKDSSGFFLLAYAAPPDFTATDLIQDYTPIRIDTDADDLTTEYPFEAKEDGVRTFAPALDSAGGLSAEFIEIASSPARAAYEYTGNYLLGVKGTCEVDGATLSEDKLVVSNTLEPQPYRVSAAENGACLALGVSF
jgi:hypothetical protein